VTEPLLLVEDSEIIAHALTRLLERENVHITVARSCAEAKELARGRWFRLCVLDLHLPDGSGVQLAEWLLQAGLVDRVVFHTGDHPSSPAVQLAMKVGAVVTKGGSPNRLTALVASLAPRDAGSPSGPR
jgi:DNA-binding response OmpR family regulator